MWPPAMFGLGKGTDVCNQHGKPYHSRVTTLVGSLWPRPLPCHRRFHTAAVLSRSPCGTVRRGPFDAKEVAIVHGPTVTVCSSACVTAEVVNNPARQISISVRSVPSLRHECARNRRPLQKLELPPTLMRASPLLAAG